MNHDTRLADYSNKFFQQFGIVRIALLLDKKF